jgi:hypothetical protein
MDCIPEYILIRKCIPVIYASASNIMYFLKSPLDNNYSKTREQYNITNPNTRQAKYFVAYIRIQVIK